MIAECGQIRRSQRHLGTVCEEPQTERDTQPERLRRRMLATAGLDGLGLTAGSYGSYLSVVEVGTKELKNRLSHYLELVRAGERILVTDRGKIVAELRGVEPQKSENEALQELAKLGIVTLGHGRLANVEPVVPKKQTGLSLSKLILDDRGD